MERTLPLPGVALIFLLVCPYFLFFLFEAGYHVAHAGLEVAL